nr:hypothetical protein [Endozoicomonas sp.]
NYFAPEVYHKAIKLWLKAHSREVAGGVSLDFPKKADIFSLGFIFFQLLADCPDRMIFYKYDSLFPCFDSFFDGFDSRWNKIISSVSIPNEELVDLVRAMTHRDPRLRPTLTEVIEKLDRTLTQSVSGQ